MTTSTQWTFRQGYKMIIRSNIRSEMGSSTSRSTEHHSKMRSSMCRDEADLSKPMPRFKGKGI